MPKATLERNMIRDQFLSFKLSGPSNAPNVLVWNNAAFDDGDDVVDEPPHLTSTSSHCVDSRPKHPSGKSVEEENEYEGLNRLDREIEAIEKEIARLNSRLNVLKLEKVESNLKNMAEKRGRGTKTRGDNTRRGMSLCPAEIISSSKGSFPVKGESPAVMPGSKMSRRVSCFWRLQEVDELNVIKERGKSSSLSPKSRKPWPKAETSGGSKNGAAVDEALPRTLFREEQKAPRAKQGRVVSSRYKNGDFRKRVLPDDAVEERYKRRLPRGITATARKKWDADDGACSPPSHFMPRGKVSRRVTETTRF